jgi:hypothetical protein
MLQRGAFFLLAAVLLVGCSSSRGPTLPTAVEAKGRILLPSGQPLDGGRVELKPTGSPGVEAFADIEPNGTFTLMTYQPGDGAIPGSYKLTISPYNYRSKTGSPTKIPNAASIPQRYLDAGKSDVTVEIKPSGNTLELRLNP